VKEMIIKEAELFKGVSQRALEEIAAVSEEESCEVGADLFRSGEEAENFFVLEEGRVDVLIAEGDHGGVHFMVSTPGEVFGLSALVEPYVYATTAKCMAPCKVLRVPREAVERVLEREPSDGVILLKNLVKLIAQRLRSAYNDLSGKVAMETAPSVPSYG